MEWISIKDQLPPKGEDVMVFGRKEHDAERTPQYGVRVDVKMNGVPVVQYWECPIGYDIEDVTHWMPMPNPPSTEDK